MLQARPSLFNPASRRSVGEAAGASASLLPTQRNISLFSNGLRSGGHHGLKPARFSFRVNRALAAALKAGGDRVQVTIVPRDIEVDGKPTAPRAETEVRLGSATLSVKRQKRQ